MALPLDGRGNNPPVTKIQVKIPSKRRIALAFGRKAATYRQYAAVQSDLIGRVVGLVATCEAGNDEADRKLLDVGCGTGLLADLCRAVGIKTRIVGMDMAVAALAIDRKRPLQLLKRVAGDMERIPFKPQSFSGAVVASVLQWLDNPLIALEEIGSILKPEGFLVFSVFVEGAFAELLATRAAFGLPASVRCPDPAAFEDLLHAAGFERIAYESINYTVYAADATTHLKGINAIGGTAAAGKTLTRKNIEDFCLTYEERFRTKEGVPLTYCALVGVCRRGNAS